MPVFEYKGRTLAGASVAGEMEAKDQKDLERILRGRRVLVSQVSRKPTEFKLNFSSKKVAKIDISRFTRQFATMIGAGLPMVQCLEILGTQAERPEMRRIINDVRESVSSGTTLSEALSKHRKVFDELYSNMVEAGEIGGALDSILVRLAGYREKADALARKVKGALVYPTVVVIVAVGVTTAMLTFIVPVFAKMFAGLGAELPTPTQVVLDISHILRSNFLFIIGAIVAGSIGFRY